MGGRRRASKLDYPRRKHSMTPFLHLGVQRVALFRLGCIPCMGSTSQQGRVIYIFDKPSPAAVFMLMFCWACFVSFAMLCTIISFFAIVAATTSRGDMNRFSAKFILRKGPRKPVCACMSFVVLGFGWSTTKKGWRTPSGTAHPVGHDGAYRRSTSYEVNSSSTPSVGKEELTVSVEHILFFPLLLLL